MCYISPCSSWLLPWPWGHCLIVLEPVKESWVDSLLWCHNGHDGVSNHQPHDCLLNRLFRPRSKKTSKLNVTGLCAGNSPVTGRFPAQMASNVENVSIWWRHHNTTKIEAKHVYISWNALYLVWRAVCQKQVSRAGTSNYITQIL